MDPGYLPFEFPNEYDKDIEPKGFKPPMVKDIMINSISTKLKWCLTCHIYRYPRVSHCSICQRCVEIFDHHCPWINNCVGKRNYRCFILFLISTVIHGYTSVFRSVIIIIDKSDKISDFIPIFAIVLVCLTLIFLIPLTGLTCFHLFLISNSRTTNEHVTSKFLTGLNPYDQGCPMNVISFLCKPEYPRSRYDPHKAIKMYSNFFRVNEKLGEQKKAVINELRGKLKKPDLISPKKCSENTKGSFTGEKFSKDRRPVAPPYNSIIKKSERSPPVPPPHGYNRLSNTSESTMNTVVNSKSYQPIVIPPSVPPHRSLSNAQSDSSSGNWSNTPIYLHNVSPIEITKGKKEDTLKSSPTMDDRSNNKVNNNIPYESHPIIQRPMLSVKSQYPHSFSVKENGNSIGNRDLSNSQMSVNQQRNRLISNGRVAQFENQSPPPEGTVEISI